MAVSENFKEYVVDQLGSWVMLLSKRCLVVLAFTMKV